jgi:hypothetical protein
MSNVPQLIRDVTIAESGRFEAARNQVIVRPYPFPYRAALAVSNDLDSSSPEAFEAWHAYVNGRKPTPNGDGLGLEVADSFWIWSGTGNTTLALHYQFPDEETFVDSPISGRIVELAKLGWFDTLHSLGNWRRDVRLTEPSDLSAGKPKASEYATASRHEVLYAFDKLDRLGIKPEVYVNHSGSPSNVGGPWGFYQKADVKDHPLYCMDLMKNAGIKYHWIDAATDTEKFGNDLSYSDNESLAVALARFPWAPFLRRRVQDKVVPVELPSDPRLARQMLLNIFNSSLFTLPAQDGQLFYAFKRYRGAYQPTASTFPIQVTSAELDELERQRGCVIVYQHFGVFSHLGRSPLIGRRMRRRTASPVFDQHAVACWEDIAERWRSNRLFVAATGRLLNYLWLRRALIMQTEKLPEKWVVTLMNFQCPVLGNRPVTASDLNGFSLLVPAEAPDVVVILNGASQPLKVTRDIDPVHPDHHAVYLAWSALEWPQK